ncbi:MAG: NrpR regulatory domain-containing protein, partial [Desulfuromonadales bacterium]|nr:NrpR regulatory domain-containing protein [Desulfuromonadales bacterium]
LLMILRILQEEDGPIGSRMIAARMSKQGVALSERTIRYHLRMLDERGLTTLVDRHDGRVITESGAEEINNARVRDKVGLSISRIENLAFQTTFDPRTGRGVLPMNVSFFPKRSFKKALVAMKGAFKAGLAISQLVAVAEEGNRIGGLNVPAGQVAFATVCSITINGVLLKRGIPMDSKFGGILEINQTRPVRFVELINYSGSSLDPSEVFILGKMTSVRAAVEGGRGKILANFREIPARSGSLVEELVKELREVGIGGVLSLGRPGDPLCEIPLDINKVGMILLGGLNPVACAHEAGIAVENRAMSMVLDYQSLRSFGDVCREA